ncbi:MAG: ATP-binding protein [Abditibacteriales bacterium]|nr:ATP-binding protein [Abditibacteriales bacterium]MDW8367085.1 ATP-binding protein [Abditibacteriales bacterium]
MAISESAKQDWVNEIRSRYEAGVAVMFLVTGNVFDLYRWQETYLPMRPFLYRALGGEKLVIYYSLNTGIACATEEMEKQLRAAIRVAMQTGAVPEGSVGMLAGDVHLPSIRDPRVALPLLERILLTRDRVVLVIDYAEALAPAGDFAFMSSDKVQAIYTLRGWGENPLLLRKDSCIILVAENNSEINSKLLSSSSRVEMVKVPMPTRQEILDHIRYLLADAQTRCEFEEDLTPEILAGMCVGLSLVHVDDLFRESRKTGVPLTRQLVSARKRELIEMACAGIVSFVEGGFTLDDVGALHYQKRLLSRVAEHIRKGTTRLIPQGIMCVGGPGTGKSFIIRCFAASCGIPAAFLANFWDKYVGETEAKLERLFRILEAMGPVFLIIDEFAQVFGSRGGHEGDSGLRQRVWGMFTAFLGSPRAKGRVILVGMDNRPDKIDPAMKRASRFDWIIPFFNPTPEEQPEILKVAIKNNHINCKVEDFTPVVEALRGKSYSSAALERMVKLADELSAMDGRDEVTIDDLVRAVHEYNPSEEQDPDIIEYMTLTAARSVTMKSLIPPHYREMLESGKMDERLRQLRAQLQMRGAL